MKKQSFLILAFLFTALSMAQYNGQLPSNIDIAGVPSTGTAAIIAAYLGDIDSRSAKRNMEYEDFQGSPYVSNTFLPTTIFLNDENLGNMYYRYNALNEEIEIKNSTLENEAPKSLLKDKAVSIIVNGKKMSFMTFVTAKNKTINGYLTTLNTEEDYALFKRIHVKFSEGKAASNSLVRAVPSRFSQYTEYYFQKKGVNRIDEIPLKNSSFTELFDESSKEELKKFLKDNNLNIKDELDLIKTFDFLNK